MINSWLIGLFYATSIFGDLPTEASIASYHPPVASHVVARNGELLTRFYVEDREFMSLDDIPEKLQQAFIAAEDSRFYEHDGIDLTAFARAMVQNLVRTRHNQRLLGASTITQQLSKQVYAGNQRTVTRKLRELLIAKRLEQALSKDRILELYLNEIFFGRGAYGVKRASEVYFNKPLDQLGIEEIALLASLPKAPSAMSKKSGQKRLLARRNWIIDQMVEAGVIPSVQAWLLKRKEIDIVAEVEPRPAVDNYYLDQVRRDAMDLIGSDRLMRDGLTISVSLDSELQKAAENSLRKGLMVWNSRKRWKGPVEKLTTENWVALSTEQRVDLLQSIEKPKGTTGWHLALVTDPGKRSAAVLLDDGSLCSISAKNLAWARGGSTPSHTNRLVKSGFVVLAEKKDETVEEGVVQNCFLRQVPEINGAIVAIDPNNGQILALAGGFDFWGSEFNRASQARRQPGSAFKPIVYFTALNSGFQPQDLIEDAPLIRVDDEGEIWQPKNADGGYRGTLTLQQALKFSRNIPAIRLAEEVGLERLLSYAQFLGMAKDQGAYPALALGVGETSAIEIAGAYSIIANKGRVVVPSTVNQIRDVSDGLLADIPALTCTYCRSESELSGRIRELLYERKPEITITPQSFEHIRKMLRAVVSGGTGQRVGQGLPKDTSGKTGTTNDYRDAWFVGFTDEIGDTSLLVATYVGYDQPKSLGRGGTGGRAAGPIFRNFMQQAMKIRSQSPKSGAKSLDKLPVAWKEWIPYTVRDSGGLNLRQGPGTGHSVVSYMPASAEIAVHKCQSQWCELSFDGAIGYAHQDYITRVGEPRRNMIDLSQETENLSEHPALTRSPVTLEMIDEWEANFGTREIVESRQEIKYGGIY